MNKVIIAALIAIVVAAIYGFTFGMESWSDNQAWFLLGVVGLILGVWSFGVWWNRNESAPRK